MFCYQESELKSEDIFVNAECNIFIGLKILHGENQLWYIKAQMIVLQILLLINMKWLCMFD